MRFTKSVLIGYIDWPADSHARQERERDWPENDNFLRSVVFAGRHSCLFVLFFPGANWQTLYFHIFSCIFSDILAARSSWRSLQGLEQQAYWLCFNWAGAVVLFAVSVAVRTCAVLTNWSIANPRRYTKPDFGPPVKMSLSRHQCESFAAKLWKIYHDSVAGADARSGTAL